MKTGKPIIGLAGGIGSGKSTVAAMMRKLGAAVINADEIGHEMLDQPDVIAEVQRWWGSSVVSPDDRANREAIRLIVSRDPQARTRLEGLLHPRIDRRSRELLARHQADPEVRAVVWDAPLLYEAGLDRYCDRVVFVETDEASRVERVARQRGWSPEDLRTLENSQKPLDFKRKKADYVINNSDNDDLSRQVEDVFSRILSGG
ncbi:MAG: dephospho-CoA kinase [Phycisphaerales bacterium]|nr:dephospho-CoA kinase [Phycisphaerales bacterium]